MSDALEEQLPASPFEDQAEGPNPAEEGAVRAELAGMLEADQSVLGGVYRGLEKGLTADQIAAELGVSTPGFVYTYKRMVEGVLDGTLPSAPTVATQVARRFRSILKSKALSPEARGSLERSLTELELRAEDQVARVVETQEAQEETERAEARNEVGIYVYALPHYIRYPFDPASGRTLLKVGHSASDVIQRFRSQTRTTALPEEPILLRIYRTDIDRSAAVESQFHRLLEAADHTRNVARTAGREWFVTSLRFVDEVAHALGLPVLEVNEGLVTEE